MNILKRIRFPIQPHKLHSQRPETSAQPSSSLINAITTEQRPASAMQFSTHEVTELVDRNTPRSTTQNDLSHSYSRHGTSARIQKLYHTGQTGQETIDYGAYLPPINSSMSGNSFDRNSTMTRPTIAEINAAHRQVEDRAMPFLKTGPSSPLLDIETNNQPQLSTVDENAWNLFNSNSMIDPSRSSQLLPVQSMQLSEARSSLQQDWAASSVSLSNSAASTENVATPSDADVDSLSQLMPPPRELPFKRPSSRPNTGSSSSGPGMTTAAPILMREGQSSQNNEVSATKNKRSISKGKVTSSNNSGSNAAPKRIARCNSMLETPTYSRTKPLDLFEASNLTKTAPRSSPPEPFSSSTIHSTRGFLHESQNASNMLGTDTTLARYTALPLDERMEELNSQILRLLDDDNFITLCEDVENCWQRIGIDGLRKARQ